MSWKSGVTYSGTWKNGQPHGIGKMYDRIGFYDGNFEKGLRKGKGTMGHKGVCYQSYFEITAVVGQRIV